MKICIYGGSFNPPHLGHTAALRAVRAAVEPDVTLVIPDRIPPHKELTPGSPEPSERLLMAMLAFSSEPGVEVSDMELHRSGKSYTADTVRELRDCNPDAELYLVVGTDMLTTFEQWHDYRALLAQVTLVALARTGDEHAEVEHFSAYLRETYGARVIALPAEPIPVTSTDVRRLLPQRRRVSRPRGVRAHHSAAALWRQARSQLAARAGISHAQAAAHLPCLGLRARGAPPCRALGLRPGCCCRSRNFTRLHEKIRAI